MPWVSTEQPSFRPGFREFARFERPAMPVSLRPQNSVSQIGRWRAGRPFRGNPFEVHKIGDFEVGFGRRLQNGDDTSPAEISWRSGCTVLVEKGVFSRSAEAIADEVS